jgi:hypothetical protein
MKTKQLLTAASLLLSLACTSCKKNYTCTCTTVVGTASTTQTHSIDNSTHSNAQNTCNNYQTQANNSLPGSGTTCGL